MKTTYIVRGAGWFRTFALTLVVCLSLPGADACPYSVRQVGFVVLKREPYRLYYLITDDTPDKERLAAWFEAADYILADSNVEAALVNVDQQKAHEALIFSIGLEIEEFPAAFVVSPRGDRTIPLGLELETFSAEAAAALLDKVVSSPKREELKSHIVKHWCVVMLVKGSDASKNKKAEAELKAAIEQAAGSTTELGKVIETPPYLLVVDADDTAEEVFLWSLGLPRAEASEPRALVLFARGQQIGPVLQGRTLTKAWVRSVIRKVGMNCACMTDTRWVSGPRIPLRWEHDRQEQVRRLVGIDPDNPSVRLDVARIWRSNAQPGQRSEGPLGYTEGYLDYPEGLVPDAPGGLSAEAASSGPYVATRSGAKAEPISMLEKHAGHVLTLVIAGMAVVALAFSGVLLWKRRGA